MAVTFPLMPAKVRRYEDLTLRWWAHTKHRANETITTGDMKKYVVSKVMKYDRRDS